MAGATSAMLREGAALRIGLGKACLCFACDGLGHERLPDAWAALQQDALGRLGLQPTAALRVLQELREKRTTPVATHHDVHVQCTTLAVLVALQTDVWY